MPSKNLRRIEELEIVIDERSPQQGESNRLETMNSNLGYISDRALFSYPIICGNYLFRN